MMLKLNLGAGRERIPGFHSVDINPNVGPDILLAADDLHSIGHNTVEEIRAVDVLEHMPYRWTGRVLREWARVLVPGGLLYVQVPDAERIMTWYVKDKRLLLERLPADLPRTPEMGAAWRLLGGQEDGTITQEGDDWHFNCHYALFSPESLIDALDAAGFSIDKLEINVHPNICCHAHKR